MSVLAIVFGLRLLGLSGLGPIMSSRLGKQDRGTGSKEEPVGKRQKLESRGCSFSSAAQTLKEADCHPWMVTVQAEIARMNAETTAYNNAAENMQDHAAIYNDYRIQQRTNLNQWYRDNRLRIYNKLDEREVPRNTMHQTRTDLSLAILASNVPAVNVANLVEDTMQSHLAWLDERDMVPTESDDEFPDGVSLGEDPSVNGDVNEATFELQEMHATLKSREEKHSLDIFKVNGQLALCNKAWWLDPFDHSDYVFKVEESQEVQNSQEVVEVQESQEVVNLVDDTYRCDGVRWFV